jgi:hypothetical protein
MQFIKVNQKIESSSLINKLSVKFPDYKIKTVYYSNNIITIKKGMIMAVIDVKYTNVTVSGKLNRQNLGYLFTFCFCGLFGGIPALIAHAVINNKKNKEYTNLENNIISIIEKKYI